MGSDRIAVEVDERRRPCRAGAAGQVQRDGQGDVRRDRRHVPGARARRRGAGDPALGPGQAFHRRARPRICRRSSSPRTRIRARAAEARLRHIEWLQDAFSALEAGRAPVIAAIHGGCIGAGVDLASGLRPARRQRRRLLPGRRGRRRDHRRSRHAAAARLSDPAGRAPGARLIPAGGWAPRRRRATASSTALEADRDAAIAGGHGRWRGRSPPNRRWRWPAPRRASTTAAAAPVEEGLRDVALWNAATLVSADLTEAIKARLGKTEPSFGPLED